MCIRMIWECLRPLSDFPGGSDGKASAYNAGDPGSIPGSGRSPGEGNGNPLQYSCLENSMDGGAKSDTTERLHLGHSVAVNFIDLLALHISKCSYNNSMTF